ncbi:MAG: methyltransferase domain-containing protein [Betaproteobacteria bacterium]|nr:methyltransferase domain-containing protein [Betaproteobacteria bacterium]
MGTVDVYRITDRLDQTTLDVLVARLEARGKHPRVIEMISEYLGAMNIDGAQDVLDIGCGTGVVSRAIARRLKFGGRIIGIDLSPYLTHAAARLAEAEGLGHRIDFRTGDSHILGIPERSLDAVVAHTLLSHVDNPGAVLAEIYRILKPGGTAAIFDGDFASMTFASSDPEQGKRDEERIINAIVTQPLVMRQMPELLQQAGFKLEKSFPYVVADIGTMDYWVPGIESFRKVLPKSGAMSQQEADRWADAMVERSNQGTFFGASNFYTYIARRP